MPIEPRLELPYRVRFDEAGPDGLLRASGYLRWAQDMAWRHSEAAGLDRDWYAEQGLTWLIRAAELDIVDRLAYGMTADVLTEITGFRRVWARRRTSFRDAAGKTVASSLTDWVLINERGVPVRVPQAIAERFAGDVGTFSPLRVELSQAPRSASWREFAVRGSEIDPLGHVNNAAYLDYLDEHLARPGGDATAALPRRYRLEFVLSAAPGTELLGRAWPDDGSWSYRLSDADGREVLRASLDTDGVRLVGG
jgi:acyl-CoA thioesterase FadM